MVKSVVPALVRVTDCGRLVVPTACPANETLEGERTRAGPSAVAPVKWMVCGAPGALSAMVMAAVNVAGVFGVKSTMNVQAALGARVVTQVFWSMEKFAEFGPLREKFAIAKFASPVFCSVRVMAVGMPMGGVPKSSIAG